MSQNDPHSPPSDPQPSSGPPPSWESQPASYDQGQSFAYQPASTQPAEFGPYGSGPTGHGQPQPSPTGDFPGRTLGIVGLILSIFTTVIGVVVSVVALRQSKRAGFKNTPALIGVIVGIITTVLAIVLIVAAILIGMEVAQQYGEVCRALGPGEHNVGGVSYTCS